MSPERWARVKEVFDACLEMPSDERADYLERMASADPALCEEVHSLLRSHETTVGFLDRPVLDQQPADLRLGAWRIHGMVGEGGMSRVYRAERDDGVYRQLAALKILKPGLDSDHVVRHFHQERQILAEMSHPNIARLLDGGITQDGRPYFVMEFVDGEPIDIHAEQRRLGTRQRLELFLAVCSAVHYAHQRLIVHRDLKPGNILVNADGAVKLLDFGIAKLLDPERRTVTAAQMLTPEYASPEQIQGSLITTASDVYSLGVVLYRLLTGRSPYRLETPTAPALARAICEQEPAAPSTGELDAVILKALEKDPERRYGSVEQLSQDIQRFLKGQPVQARPQTVRYRMGKFVRRNRLAVTAAAVAVLSLAAGMGTTLWQASRARRAQQQAEQNLREVRRMAYTMLFEIHDAIRDLAGATAARAKLVERATAHLDRMLATHSNNPALTLELAEAYLQLGDVQGNSSQANLGDRAAARRSYEKALQLLEQKESSAEPSRRLRLVARLLQRLGGIENATRAMKLLESLSAEPDKLTGASRESDLSLAYGSMADEYVERRQLPQALEFRQKQLSLWEAILARNPSDTKNLRDCALVHKRLGALLWKLDRAGEAMPHYEKALGMEQEWSRREPANADARFAVSFSESDIGFLLSSKNRHREGLAHYLRAVKVREQLAEMDPNNARGRHALISIYWRTASVHTALGEIREALGLLGKAEKMLGDARNADQRRDLGRVLLQYGLTYLRGGRRMEALAALERSKKTLTDLKNRNELDADGADALSSAEQELSVLLAAQR
ncbi:MAG: protein kinase [Acidobacteria bacterium]|nr:protein kinase [Acidobacteriota bacterium]